MSIEPDFAMEEPDEGQALDDYSRVVIRVAESVTPHVAAIEMMSTGRRGQVRVGSGSAVVFTADGYMLTNAHVVAGLQSGRAVFADGKQTDVELVGADPLSDLAVVAASSPPLHRPCWAMPTPCAWANW